MQLFQLFVEQLHQEAFFRSIKTARGSCKEAFWLHCIPVARTHKTKNEASSSLINDRNIISRHAAISQQQ
jgi:hypothetical protein